MRTESTLWPRLPTLFVFRPANLHRLPSDSHTPRQARRSAPAGSPASLAAPGCGSCHHVPLIKLAADGHAVAGFISQRSARFVPTGDQLAALGLPLNSVESVSTEVDLSSFSLPLPGAGVLAWLSDKMVARSVSSDDTCQDCATRHEAILFRRAVLRHHFIDGMLGMVSARRVRKARRFSFPPARWHRQVAHGSAEGFIFGYHLRKSGRLP